MYYATGTTFAFTQPSNVLPGEFLFGDDSVAIQVNTTGTGTPLSGTVGAWSMVVSNSRVLHEVGVTGVTYLIGALDQGGSASVTPGNFDVIDVNGNMAANNVNVSGQSGVLINGSVAAVTLSTAYGVKKFTQVTGNNWIAY